MNTLAERAKSSRKNAGLSQVLAAKKIGIRQPSLSAIESGKTKKVNSTTLVNMARVYKVDAAWIETGKDILENQIKEPHAEYNIDSFINITNVPIINMVQAGDWTEIVEQHQEDMVPCPYYHSDKTFAVRISGQSMCPEFPEGMVIFIDPNQQPENKQYCVAKLDDTNEATFKQYVIEDGQKYLKAINPEWPKKYIEINGNCQIIGRLIGVYQQY